jgi:heme oxygenase
MQQRGTTVEDRGDLHAALRRATASRHRALDDALAFARTPLTRERYVAFLQGSLRVLAVLEPALARWPGAGVEALRVASLRADLRTLGRSCDAGHADVRGPESLAEAFGAAYVVEGSALGGRVLAGVVQRALGERTPTSYLRLRGGATHAHWQHWLARLQAFEADTHSHERASTCTMACTTFDSYARSLAQESPVTA